MNSTAKSGIDGPLKGVKVLDWTMHQFGPVSAAMLGDMGADVIKIEALDGDVGRAIAVIASQRTALKGGRNAYFESANRNKRGIAVNLKTEEGREIVYKLVEQTGRADRELPPGGARETRHGLRDAEEDQPEAHIWIGDRLRPRGTRFRPAIPRRVRPGARRSDDVLRPPSGPPVPPTSPGRFRTR